MTNDKVQVRHGSCWGIPRCVCAVAARSGRDVFVLDFCSGREFINFPMCEDKSLQVYKDGDFKYRVIFPTGTSLKVYMYNYKYWRTTSTLMSWYINVEVYPTISDEPATSGLCGYLDDIPKNDLRWKNGFQDDPSQYNYYKHPDNFSKSWRLPSGSSEDLLQHDASIYDNLQGMTNYSYKLCYCDEVKGPVCSYQRYQNCKTDSRGRSKRQAFTSQEDATTLCTKAFQESAHYKDCLQNVPNFGNETFINCINDIMMTGDENLTTLHVETALDQCKEYIYYNSTLQTDKKEIVTTISMLCSKNCSNRGYCNQGNCTCDPGYGGSDCSFDMFAPPTITRISDFGLCDKTTESCDNVFIYGRYFVKNLLSSCFIRRSEISESQSFAV
ncbi:von Willebrand factor D and EGF domain-containing protein-like [Saccostrea cucullata]|uniref:von Willebrand factor D and EGF domain-containing protein-like n=1 Tax=Saccostrea cuccullata TaxID=36930 RepID=UPI002ED5B1AC